MSWIITPSYAPQFPNNPTNGLLWLDTNTGIVWQFSSGTSTWSVNDFYTKAGALPSLDLRFAENKSLVDYITGQQLVTFARSSPGGTFTDSAGVLQTAVTNLVLRSEELDNSVWTKVGGTISANSIASPNGAITADTIVEDTSTGTHRCVNSATIANATIYTVSAYAKAAGRTHVRLSLGSGLAGELTANLSNGTVAVSFGATNPTVQLVGNGWYRISFTSAASSGTTGQVQLQLIQGTNTPSYTGDGVSGAYFWGAQLEQASTVGEYVPTTSAINSAPRFDHNPTTGESLGLLVEEARTNGLIYSEDTSQWLAPTNITLSQNQTVAPDGASTADQYLETAATGLHVQDSMPFAFVTSTVYTYSVFVKSIGGRNFEIGYPITIFTNRFARFNLSGSGSVQGSDAGVTASIQAYANGWYRCSATNTCASGASSRIGNFIIDSSFARSYAGDVTKGMFIWGAQLEAGAFPTSYIPTTTAAATRAADVASITGSAFSSWYNATQGSLHAEYSIPFDSSTSIFPIIAGFSDNTFNNTAMHYNRTIDDGRRALVRSGGTSSFDQPNASAYVYGQIGKQAFAYTSSEFAFSAVSAAPAVSSSITWPTVDRFGMGNSAFVGGSNSYLNGTIRRLAYWGQRLSNSTLQSITQ
jgi:hypothetical protein